MKALIGLLLLVLTSAGCASMTSTIMNRDDHDNFSRNQGKRQKGIPVTVNIPTHLKVRIEEEYYLVKDPNHPEHPLIEVQIDKPILSVEQGFDYEEKMFMVDLKRPGAGTLQTDIQLDAETQYFKAIKGKVVDNTIRELTNIVNQFGIEIARETSGSISKIRGNQIIVDKRTVAYGRFDINAVDFESQLEAFFDKHINHCNHCRAYSN